MAKNITDYRNEGIALFNAGSARPNGTSWQKAAMGAGWDHAEGLAWQATKVIREVPNINFSMQRMNARKIDTKHAVESHIRALKSQALDTPISSAKYYKLADKVHKLQIKYSHLL